MQLLREGNSIIVTLSEEEGSKLTLEIQARLEAMIRGFFLGMVSDIDRIELPEEVYKEIEAMLPESLRGALEDIATDVQQQYEIY